MRKFRISLSRSLTIQPFWPYISSCQLFIPQALLPTHFFWRSCFIINSWLLISGILSEKDSQPGYRFHRSHAFEGTSILFLFTLLLSVFKSIVHQDSLHFQNMPLFLISQVKDLRSSGDETARIIVACQQENLEPPTGLRKDFEHILAMVFINWIVFFLKFYTTYQILDFLGILKFQTCPKNSAYFSWLRIKTTHFTHIYTSWK